MFGRKKQFQLATAKPTRLVIIQVAIGSDGKPGRLAQDGVASVNVEDGWLRGFSAFNRCLIVVPAVQVSAAFIEEVSNG